MHPEPTASQSYTSTTAPTQELSVCYEELHDLLYAAHISMMDGYHYSGDSMGTFHWAMRFFAESYEIKRQEIVQAYHNYSANPKAYTVSVHSLKSNARTIGANTLADICYSHERKSKEQDYAYIAAHFEELEHEWRLVIEGIQAYFGENS